MVVVVPVTVEVELPAVADFYCRICFAAERLSVGAGIDRKSLLDNERSRTWTCEIAVRTGKRKLALARLVNLESRAVEEVVLRAA